ncbi:TonB-dependent receptor [Paraglaciecola aquimarina]|uniref:TonB-dependent receptor n=1 Tax=Paraglaciecola algarum TaxID=3050085 RepID=A0ABS9D8C2_9ALTE|nr:TonB-dependent receptor [Paraglaciecola sp. G1-23]MCF2949169.1 TonB-dependent receptor [Paraglaciecola sp. G1-23]
MKKLNNNHKHEVTTMGIPISAKKRRISFAVTAALFSLGSTSLFAQEAEKSTDDEKKIEVIQITAERRVTNLQETPIAVSVMTQEALSKNNIKDVTDLTGFVPSLVVSGQEDQSDIKIYIRGVGTNNPTETGDQGVGVYVDGVFAARAQGALALMFDLEAVQVLRGPQGTLFGRNNTGGAVLLESRKPGKDFEGDMQVTFGKYNRQQISGAVTLPVTDDLSFRFAAYMESDDGWVDSIDNDPRGTEHGFSGTEIGRSATTQTKLNNTDVQAARITGVWDLMDDLKWTMSYESFSDQGNHGILLNPVEVEQGRYQAFIDSPIFLDLTTDVVRSTLSYDISENINAEYIFGGAKLFRTQVVDQDGGITSRFQEGRTEYQHSDSISHELKIQNTNGGPFSWTAGVYYFEEETAIRFDFDGVGPWLNGEGNTFIQPARGLESQAVYAQATYDLSKELSFTAGVRYTDDLKYDRGGRNAQDCPKGFIRPDLGGSELSIFEDFLNNTTGAEGPDGYDDYKGIERVRGQCAATLRNDVEDESDKLTYLGRLSYQLDDHMFYGSVGTGYRSGVIQDGGQVTEPENSTSYEIGSKSDFDNVRLNLAAFFIDYEDLIRSGFDEDIQQIVNSNVAAAEITGLEAEIIWMVGDGGRFDFSGSYLDAVYTDYITDGGGSGTNNLALVDENGEPTGFYDLSGNYLPQSPKYQISASFSWEFNTKHGDFVPRISARFVDDVFFRDENENRTFVNNLINDVQQTGEVWGNPAGQEAHSKVDLGMTYYPSNGDWTVDFFINNLTDEMTRSSTTVDNGTAAGLPGRYAAPRSYGVRFNTFF